jgi:hypothetical protein
MICSGDLRAELIPGDYSNFGIGVDRKNAAKWRFPQENGTFRCSQEVYVYSEIALVLLLRVARSNLEPDRRPFKSEGLTNLILQEPLE